MRNKLYTSVIAFIFTAVLCSAETGNVFGITSLAYPDVPLNPRYGTFTGIDAVETSLYDLAVNDMVLNLEKDGTFRTGKLWGGVWTRDLCYSLILSLAHVEPAYSKESLFRKVDRLGRIIQDTGTGGAWPCSTDRAIWIPGAYELWLETGDMEFLKKIYEISARSIAADYAVAFDPSTGLMRGESSFIDWREQSYPEWMDCKDISQSECLGTNAAFVGALLSLEKMAKVLGNAEAAADYAAKATALKEAINKNFWIAEKGYYGQYLYGRNFKTLSQRSETLGEALCILWDVASPTQAQSIIANMPISQYGPTIFWPQIAAQRPYHNNGIWPFVTTFYAIAAAKAGSQSAVYKAMEANATYAAAHGTNYENRVSSDGSTNTCMNSPRQLWSIAGYMGMYRRIIFGMEYKEDGIHFSPLVPDALSGERNFNGLKYRNMILNINLIGSGSKIKFFTVDGKASENYFVPCTLSGEHNVTIELVPDSRVFDIPVNVLPYTADIAAPKAKISNNMLIWDAVEGAASYKVLHNGEFAGNAFGTSFNVSDIGEYSVIAIKADGVESFMSEPIRNYNVELEHNATKNLTERKGKQFKTEIRAPYAGEYAIDWSYSNGNGETTTQNKCSTRTMYVDGKPAGAVIFPQRGNNNWESQGWSSVVKLKLKRGSHKVELLYEDADVNMNIDTDNFMLHSVRLTRIK